MFWGIYLRAILQIVYMNLIHKMCLEIKILNYQQISQGPMSLLSMVYWGHIALSNLVITGSDGVSTSIYYQVIT